MRGRLFALTLKLTFTLEKREKPKRQALRPFLHLDMYHLSISSSVGNLPYSYSLQQAVKTERIPLNAALRTFDMCYTERGG